MAVDYNGQVITVEVPSSGVKKGERFIGHVVTSIENDNGHNIPVGGWRDDTFDCFRLGICHPSLCLSFFFTPCALGQVMTRMKLDKMGFPTSSPARSRGMSTFRFLFFLTFVYIVVYGSLDIVLTPYQPTYDINEDGDLSKVEPDVPDWARVLFIVYHIIHYAFALYILVLMFRTRNYIRAKYFINDNVCSDCLCSYFCGCCTVSQMLRHTADYSKHDSVCCSEDGLGPLAPEVV